MNLNIRLLLQDSPTAREHQKFQKNYNESIKILPRKTPLRTNMVIVPGKTIIHELNDPMIAIVIENKSVAQMNTELFETIWNSIA
jgi:hypothetical protein